MDAIDTPLDLVGDDTHDAVARELLPQAHAASGPVSRSLASLIPDDALQSLAAILGPWLLKMVVAILQKVEAEAADGDAETGSLREASPAEVKALKHAFTRHIVASFTGDDATEPDHTPAAVHHLMAARLVPTVPAVEAQVAPTASVATLLTPVALEALVRLLGPWLLKMVVAVLQRVPLGARAAQ